MYEWVGSYENPRKLADLAPLLHPQPCQQGYCTTDRAETQRIYESHLRDTFTGKWKQAMLAIVWADGTIPPHQDGDNVADGYRRYHLVLQSNDKCWYLHDGAWQQLQEGGIYTMDPIKTHAAVNWGNEPRIHFVVDTCST